MRTATQIKRFTADDAQKGEALVHELEVVEAASQHLLEALTELESIYCDDVCLNVLIPLRKQLDFLREKQDELNSLIASLEFEPGVPSFYKGFSIEYLKEIFDEIKNPNDWKDAIFCKVKGEWVTAAVAAIEYYTATTPTISLDTEKMDYYISSEGYRMGPAGDH